MHQLLYNPGLDNDELAAKMQGFGIGRKAIYADSAEPKSIKTLQKKGFNVRAADKGADSIAYGIRELQAVEIYITEESKDFWFEAEEYHWALDANKDPTDVPEDENNHLWDAARYAYTMHCLKKQGVTIGTPGTEETKWEKWVNEANMSKPRPILSPETIDVDDEYGRE